MRRSPFILAAAVPLAVLVALYVFEREEKRGAVGRVTTSRPTTDSGPTAGAKAHPTGVVDFGAARSRDLFKEDPDEVTIGGKRVRYQRNLFAAKTAEGIGDGVLVATDITWLANGAPKNRAAVERLVTVETRLLGDVAGEAVREGFGRTTGVRADKARIIGGERLSELKSMELSGRVRAVFVDPETPGERIDVETESLDIEFEGGRPVSARAKDAVKITRPSRGDAEVSGDGLSVTFVPRADGELAVSEFVVKNSVRAHLFDPAAARLKGPPISFTAAGPLRWRMTGMAASRSNTASKRSRTDAGVIDIEGGLAGTQGPLRFRAGTGRITFADDGSRIRLFEAEKNVRADGDGIGIDAGSMAIEPTRTGRAVFKPGTTTPLRAVLQGVHLPGAVLGETTVTAAGALTIEPSPDAVGGATDVYRVHASTRVVAEAAAGRLTAGDATLFFGTLGGRRVPLKLALARGVDGMTDEAELKAEELTFDRDYESDGTPRLETLVLKKNYMVRYFGKTGLSRADELVAGSRPTSDATSRQAAESEPSTRSTTRPELKAVLGLLRSADAFVVEGVDRFEASRAPFDDAPSLLGVKGRAEFRLETRDKKKTAGRILCGRASLVVRPERDPVTRKIDRRIDAFTAEVGVTAEIPGLVRGTGEVLRLKLADEEAVFQGGARPARVVVRGRDGVSGDVEETFDAGRFIWNAPLLKLTAEAGMAADVLAAPLPWITDAGADPKASGATSVGEVKTIIEAGRATVVFDPDVDGATPRKPREIDARDGVVMRQPGRRLTGKTVQFDLGMGAGALTGAPLVYVISRPDIAEGAEDRVEAPRAAIAEKTLLVDGPMTGRLFVGRELSAFRVGDDAADDGKPSAKNRPIGLSAKGGGSFGPTYCRLDGGVAAQQGDPKVDGFEASARTAEFFLGRDERGRPDLALVALRSEAVFRSKRFQAACDIMQFERAERRLKLYNERPEPVRLLAEGVSRAATGEASSLLVTFGGGRIVVEQTDVSMFLKPPPSKTGDGR